MPALPLDDTDIHPTVSLSQRDISRLLEEESTAVREEIIGKVASHYCQGGYSEMERPLAEQIFRLLMQDVDWHVRRAMSVALKDAERLPEDVVQSLIRDIDEVAVPFLEYSQLVSDADLLEIIRYALSPAKPAAIAARSELSFHVANALVSFGDPRVTRKLLGNRDALLGEAHYMDILHRFRDDKDVLKAMTEVPNLPKRVLQQMAQFVASQLARSVAAIQPEHREVIVEAAKEAEQAVVDHLPALLHADEELLERIYRLHKQDRLNEFLVLGSVARGELPFFTAALARLAQIPVQNAATLTADKGERGFKALYQRAKLPMNLFTAVRTLLHASMELQMSGVKPIYGSYQEKLIAKLEAHCGEPGAPELSTLMALIRQNQPVH